MIRDAGDLRRLTCELLGTAILVATVIGSGIMGESLAAGNAAVALLGNTIATGAILVVIILGFGPVSGAHFNPAVSLVFALRRELPWRLFAPYVAAQIIGGLLGTLAAHAMFDLPLIQISTHARTGAGIWLGEIIASFGLVLTILLTLKHRPDTVPWTVGLFITAGYWFTSSTSFANPAVAIARGFSDTFAGIAPGDVPAFIAAELIGAVVGAAFVGWLVRSPAPAPALDAVVDN
jgi:glycerol uptake facilitator-like aquaporin